MTRDTAFFKEGVASARFDLSAASGGRGVNFRTVAPNQLLTYEGWIWVPIGESVSVRMLERALVNGGGATTSDVSLVVTGNDDWQYFSFTRTMNASTNSVSVGLTSPGGPFTWWADSTMMRVISPVYFSLVPSGVEVKENGVDSAEVKVDLTPTTQELANYIDGGTARSVLTPSTTDTFAGVDANTARVVFTPSATQLYAPTDSGTATTVLTPSSTDIAAYVNTATAVLKFTISGTELYETLQSDQATVYLRFQPQLLFSPSGLLYSRWIYKMVSRVKQASDTKRFFARAAKPRWKARVWKA